MTKFQKIQKFLSFIPFLSSLFVFTVTSIVLYRKKATRKYWLMFDLIPFTFLLAVGLLSRIPWLIQLDVLYTIVAGGVLAVANILCVELQIRCPDFRTKSSDLQEVTQPRKSKNFRIIGLIVAGAVLLTAFVVVFIIKGDSEVMSHQIPDTNGLENTNLVTITEDEVIQYSNSCYCKMVSQGGSGNSSNVDDSYLEEYDCQSYRFRCKLVSGVGTVHATQTENENLTLTIETELISGNMEIFVLVDGQIYARLDPIEKQTVVLEDIAGKLVVVKFAAESAELSIQVTREYTP